MKIHAMQVAVVDVETTGLSSEDEIIEIAIVWPEAGFIRMIPGQIEGWVGDREVPCPESRLVRGRSRTRRPDPKP